MKELQQYTYTIPAGGSVQIPATNDNFYVQASTGPVAVRGNTFGRLRGMVAGMGLKGVPFDRLEMFDESGAPNTVTLLMTPAEFVNNTFSGSVVVVGPQSLDAATINALNRPELPISNWSDNTTAAAAPTATVIIAPGANVNGALIHAAGFFDANASTYIQQMILAKASPPASSADGEIIVQGVLGVTSAAIQTVQGQLPFPTRIAPGLGLYFWTSGPAGTSGRFRYARYSLL